MTLWVFRDMNYAFKPRKHRLLYIFPLITAGLGVWQIFRLVNKENIIGTMQSRLAEPPTPIKSPLAPLEHRRLRVEGKYLHDLEMLIGPRNKAGGGMGYFVYTPLLMDNNKVIIVNRGWIPIAHIKATDRTKLNDAALPLKKVEIEAMLRRPGSFRPLISWTKSIHATVNHPNPQWMWVDFDTMIPFLKQALGEFHQLETDFFLQQVLSDDENDITRLLSYWEEEKNEIHSTVPAIVASLKALHTAPFMFHGIPIVEQAAVTLPNKHRGYIYTWFSLTGLLLLTIILT